MEESLRAISGRAGVVAAVDLVMVEHVTALDCRVYDALNELTEPRRTGQDDQRGEPSE